jgi:hypothetical protein
MEAIVVDNVSNGMTSQVPVALLSRVRKAVHAHARVSVIKHGVPIPILQGHASKSVAEGVFCKRPAEHLQPCTACASETFIDTEVMIRAV